MKRFLAGLALCALAWSFAAPASAATIGITGPGIGVTNTPITFDVTYDADLASGDFFSGGSIKIDFQDGTGADVRFISLATLSGTFQITHTFLAGGVYTILAHIGVTSASGNHDADGQTNIEIAATPLPAALPLFATALLGLGFAGWRRRRA